MPKGINIFPIFFNIVGIVIFFFFLWKKLKEDYLPDNIFTSVFLVFGGLILGYILGIILIFPWWLWTSLLGGVIGYILSLIIFKIRARELYDAIWSGLLIWLSLYFLGDSVKNSSLFSFIGFAVILVLVGLYHYFDINYRNFSWYRSGKIGFSAFSTTALFFLLRGLSGIFFPFVLSLAGKVDMVLSFVVSFIFMALTYNLSRVKI
jgi:hypothetical protein